MPTIGSVKTKITKGPSTTPNAVLTDEKLVNKPQGAKSAPTTPATTNPVKQPKTPGVEIKTAGFDSMLRTATMLSRSEDMQHNIEAKLGFVPALLTAGRLVGSLAGKALANPVGQIAAFTGVSALGNKLLSPKPPTVPGELPKPKLNKRMV